jgi:hypothetical protein
MASYSLFLIYRIMSKTFRRRSCGLDVALRGSLERLSRQENYL